MGEAEGAGVAVDITANLEREVMKGFISCDNWGSEFNLIIRPINIKESTREIIFKSGGLILDIDLL